MTGTVPEGHDVIAWHLRVPPPGAVGITIGAKMGPAQGRWALTIDGTQHALFDFYSAQEGWTAHTVTGIYVGTPTARVALICRGQSVHATAADLHVSHIDWVAPAVRFDNYWTPGGAIVSTVDEPAP